jgi:hypothetical protein
MREKIQYWNTPFSIPEWKKLFSNLGNLEKLGEICDTWVIDNLGKLGKFWENLGKIWGILGIFYRLILSILPIYTPLSHSLIKIRKLYFFINILLICLSHPIKTQSCAIIWLDPSL